MSRRILLLICITILSSSVYAKDLGVFHKTWPIIEADFMQWLQGHLQQKVSDGSWGKLQNEFKQRVKRNADRPRPVDNISKTIEPRHWLYDPSVTLSRNITDQEGRVIAEAGSQVNPLDYVGLRHPLVFIDADDKDQMHWVDHALKTQHIQDNSRIILVKGSVGQAQKALNRKVWFDQFGKLTDKFAIKHTPAVVRQSGKRLLISEEVA